MSAATMRLHHLQAELHDAQRQAAASDREQAIENLALTRSQIREAEDELHSLAIAIKAEDKQRERLRLRLRVRSFDDKIGDSLLRRLEVADFLPNDPEVRAWQKQHDRIVKEQQKTIADLCAVSQSDRLHAVRLDKSIEQLRYTERALLAKLSGTQRERNWHPV